MNTVSKLGKTLKRCIFPCVCTILFITLPLTVNASNKPKNIIYVISDGMGPSYTAAYRYYMDNTKTDVVETTIFDQLLVGMSSTYSSGTAKAHKRKTYVTDSAASATALSTGFKTYNQAIAMSVDEKPLKTIMEYAKELNKTTGLVVTSQINHATPASFVAHNKYRYNYDEIADGYFDNRVNGKFVADLMFGGGQKYFIRKDRDIAKQFVDAGYQLFTDYNQLSQFNRLPALGLFADKGMGFAIDNREKFRLSVMTNKALELVNTNENGFFLLIEASMVDWCGHDNDIGCAMKEMDDLAKTVELVKGFIDDNPDTLMVMTADHNTGGLSIGANEQYRWDTQAIKNIRHSMNYVTQELLKNRSQDVKILWQNLVGIDIEKEQIDAIIQVRDDALNAIKKSANEDESVINEVITQERVKIGRLLASITAKNTHTGWTSGNHTGGDVQVFAYGHSAAQFNGHQDNIDIAKKLFKLIKH